MVERLAGMNGEADSHMSVYTKPTSADHVPDAYPVVLVDNKPASFPCFDGMEWTSPPINRLRNV